jgi:hypothetical protein
MRHTSGGIGFSENTGEEVGAHTDEREARIFADEQDEAVFELEALNGRTCGVGGGTCFARNFDLGADEHRAEGVLRQDNVVRHRESLLE